MPTRLLASIFNSHGVRDVHARVLQCASQQAAVRYANANPRRRAGVKGETARPPRHVEGTKYAALYRECTMFAKKSRHPESGDVTEMME